MQIRITNEVMSYITCFFVDDDIDIAACRVIDKADCCDPWWDQMDIFIIVARYNTLPKGI